MGRAKAHLHETAIALDENLKKMGARAHIGLLQALVTPSSSVIPSLPLYMAALNQEQKRAGKHETTLQQVMRLFNDSLFNASVAQSSVRLRADNLERDAVIQANVNAILNQVDADNLNDLVDVDSLRQQFLHQFGFAYDFIDYGQKPDPLTPPAIHDFSQLMGMKKAG
ncbi:hypothetical protein ACU6U9_19325 [Pseudomonas sp. HK3]